MQYLVSMGLVGVLVYAAIAAVLGSIWQYNLEHWFGWYFIEGIAFWKCWLLGCLPYVGWLSIPLAIFTLIFF